MWLLPYHTPPAHIEWLWTRYKFITCRWHLKLKLTLNFSQTHEEKKMLFSSLKFTRLILTLYIIEYDVSWRNFHQRPSSKCSRVEPVIETTRQRPKYPHETFLSFLVTWHRYKGPITRERQSNHCLNRQLYFVCDEQKYSTLLKHVTNRDQYVDVTCIIFYALGFSGGMLVLRLGAL